MENESKRQLQQQSRVFTTKPFSSVKRNYSQLNFMDENMQKEEEEGKTGKISAVWHNKRKFIEVMLCFVESPLIEV